jgi:hypothetical protein
MRSISARLSKHAPAGDAPLRRTGPPPCRRPQAALRVAAGPPLCPTPDPGEVSPPADRSAGRGLVDLMGRVAIVCAMQPSFVGLLVCPTREPRRSLEPPPAGRSLKPLFLAIITLASTLTGPSSPPISHSGARLAFPPPEPAIGETTPTASARPTPTPAK